MSPEINLKLQAFFKNNRHHTCRVLATLTKTQYSTYIRKWTLYCREKQIDTLQCSLSHILEFLTDLYEKHMSYSSINSARSVLSAISS